MNIYICPYNQAELGDFFFQERADTTQVKWVWKIVKETCEDRGVRIHTIDKWDGNKESLFIALSFIPSSHKLWFHYVSHARNSFRRRVLMHSEPFGINPLMFICTDMLWKTFSEIYMPFRFSNMALARGMSKRILLNNKIHQIRYMPPAARVQGIIPELFKRKSRRLLVFVGKNKFPLIPYKDLYAKRIEAVNFFSKRNYFDLYGIGWEKVTIYPRIVRTSAVRHVYKGPVPLSQIWNTYSNYIFALCFENSSMDGWITEKVFDMMAVGTVPIYFGGPEINRLVPAGCFINGNRFANFKDLEEYIVNLNKEDIEEYRANIMTYMLSDKFMKVTPEHWAEWFFARVVQRQPWLGDEEDT